MDKTNSFNHYKLNNSCDLHIFNSNKFKTNLIQMVIIEKLATETVSANALLPYVFYRGSTTYPTTRNFKIKLNELYGAELSISILKRGENQLLFFSLELPNENFLPNQTPLFQEGLKLLYELVLNPAMKEEYIEQEKDNLQRKIDALINDKYSYAVEKCYQEMCANEAYGLYKLGKKEDLRVITREQLLKRYNSIINNSAILFFVVGDVEDNRVVSNINTVFDFKHKQSKEINKTELISQVNDVKEIRDKKKVKQGKLIMGFRTGITRKSKSYYPLIVYNGILGAFPHSKLFQNVREKASLAYFANSGLETTKGLLLISSGIDFNIYQKAREIILQQVEEIRKGNFTAQELDWAKMSLQNRFKNTADRIDGLTGHYLLGLINNNPESIDKSLDSISAVKQEDVINIAKQIKLDTIYFLDRQEGDR